MVTRYFRGVRTRARYSGSRVPSQDDGGAEVLLPAVAGAGWLSGGWCCEPCGRGGGWWSPSGVRGNPCRPSWVLIDGAGRAVVEAQILTARSVSARVLACRPSWLSSSSAPVVEGGIVRRTHGAWWSSVSSSSV